MKKCVKCGQELAGNAIFCHVCGAKQESVENNERNPNESETPIEQIPENQENTESKQENRATPPSKKISLTPKQIFVSATVLIVAAISFAAYKIYDHFEDTKACEQIGENSNIEELQSYLGRFPHGICSKDAQFYFGKIYYNGKEVPQNYEEAAKWYQKAADQGFDKAQNNLGVMYYHGEGVSKNYDKALKYFQEAANQGFDRSQFMLAVMYYNGHSVPQNHEEAAKWALKSAEQGYTPAQSAIGTMYMEGKGVKQNYEEAVKWYQKAANQGDAGAQNNLGYAYYRGDGVKQSYEEAIKWYSKAAEQGLALAQTNLGEAYYNAQNYEEAFKWYSKSAEQGYAEAQSALASMYYDGKGVKQNYEETVKWYSKAAKQGYAKAQNRLGVIYYNGKIVKQNYEEAVQWYSKAAEQGFAAAQNNLGNAYYRGNGVKQSYEEAVQWYSKAAEQGYAIAQFSLGKAYYRGIGVEQNDNLAKKWLTKAAEQDNSEAKALLQRVDGFFGNICTGQTKCYDNNKEIPCPAPGQPFYGQDAQYAKLGKCKPLSFSVETISGQKIVVDNNTGLEWQQEISPELYSQEEAENFCNASTYAGYSDWRVPTERELFTATSTNNHWYASFSNTKDGRFYSTFFPKYFGNSYHKNNTNYVRCVRGRTLPKPLFQKTFINGNTVRIEKTTGLILAGKTTCPETRYGHRYDWKGALECCENMTYAGYSDWRLPNRNEVIQINLSEDDGEMKLDLADDVSYNISSSTTHYYTDTFWYYRQASDKNYDLHSIQCVRSE